MTGMRVLTGRRRIAAIPPGKVLIHQFSRELGGPYLVDADDPRHANREVCDCGWWGELGPHYRKVPPTDEKGIEAERRDYEVMMGAFNALNASDP
jgi:hypothetical protein